MGKKTEVIYSRFGQDYYSGDDKTWQAGKVEEATEVIEA